MNCCDEYGTCTRGPNCPARRDTPINGGKLKRVEITTPGVPGSQVARIKANPIPPEAGNVQFDADGVPLSYAETMALVRLMIYLLLGVIVFFGGLGLLVSYGTERWPEVLWAFLAGVS